MITLTWLYVLAGGVFAAFAVTSATDATNPKRWGNAAFWALVASSFLFGNLIGDLGNGVLVLALVAIAGSGQLGRGTAISTSPADRATASTRFGNRLFVPALIIPLTAFVGTMAFTHSPLKDAGVIEARWVTLILLGAGVLIALGVAVALLRPPLLAPVEEGRRLMDSIGWAALLPQMLAALGAVFATAGVGGVIGELAGGLIPHGSILLAVIVYAVGMAVFTMIMGNAFAAFPVMAAAIGIPILIQGDGGNAAVIGAVGMLSGFCGTLLTPMAANFNMVPAALLELKDRYGVIRAQAATAAMLLCCNIAILYFAGFR
jgi:uncharacterized membrane protein